MKRRVWALAVGGAALLSPAVGRAYCRSTTAPSRVAQCPDLCVTDGLPLYWQVPYAVFTFNEEGFPDLDSATAHRVIARSFAHWNAVECPAETGTRRLGFNIQDSGRTTDLEVGPEDAEPNANVIVHFDAETWAERDLDPAAFALTAVWFDTNDGEILGADMHFNGGRGRFVVCPNDGCAPGDVDLENVTTHEAGHFIGMAHSDVAGSTMWCSATPDETEKRSLSEDDIAGVCAAYPAGSFKTGPRTATGSCAVVGGARDGAGWWAWVIAVGAVVLRRRRRG